MGMPGSPMPAYFEARLSDFTWVEDRGRGPVDTYCRMLVEVGAFGGVTMEDDVVLTKDFDAKVRAVVAEYPDDLVQFHSRRTDDVTIGTRREAGSSFMNNQCTYYPPGFVPAFLAWLDAYGGPVWAKDPSGYDIALATYMREKGMTYIISVPSLADHLVSKSRINPRRSSKRQAKVFLDPDTDGHPFPEMIGGS